MLSILDTNWTLRNPSRAPALVQVDWRNFASQIPYFRYYKVPLELDKTFCNRKKGSYEMLTARFADFVV